MSHRHIGPAVLTTHTPACLQTAGAPGVPDSELCEYLDWDSSFFALRIARVRAHRLDVRQVDMVTEWCRAQHIDCLYFLADAHDPVTVRLAEDAGFRFVDVRATFTRRLDRAHAPGVSGLAGINVRLVSAHDIEALVAIARTTYGTTRFRFDSGFPPRRVDALYETWTEQSCVGYADAVLVADGAEGPCGYISCHLESTHAGRIGLVGVSASAQGRGVGRALMQGCQDWFVAHGVTQLSVVTQGRNIAAQRLYERCGFLIERMDLWYHRWFGTV